MDREEILEKAKAIDFELVKPHLNKFIEKCVEKHRRDRWRYASKSMDDLALRFNSLWNCLATEKADDLSEVKLTSDRYIYLNLEGVSDKAILLSKKEAEIVGDHPEDGLLLAKDNKQAVFLTHEFEYYHFKL